MDFASIGSVNNYIKNIKLQSKWEVRKNGGNADELFSSSDKKTDTSLIPSADEKEDRFEHEDQDMEVIMQKVQTGKKLTSAERKHLMDKDPVTYRKLVSIEEEQKSYAAELRRCHTKEEVQRVKMRHTAASLTSFQKIRNDPHITDEYKLKFAKLESMHNERISKITDTFIKSTDYKELPTDTEEAKAMRMMKEENNPEYSDRDISSDENTAAEKITDEKIKSDLDESAYRKIDGNDSPEIQKVKRSRTKYKKPVSSETDDSPAISFDTEKKSINIHV